ncbi:hypothetical protein MMC21_001391 [Puttea exsequens]|nr:hypothetical protein [Puttea exsequens]
MALLTLFIIPQRFSFPSVACLYIGQRLLELDNADIDISTGSRFHGLSTFANLPYANCYSDDWDMGRNGAYDIAIIGAPFDTAVSARPGARFGPSGIRQGSRRLSPEAGWNVCDGENTFLDWAKILDCGDVPLTYFDNTVALKQLEKAHRLISGRTAEMQSKSSIPRIIALGGDHTTTLPALRSAASRWGNLSVIHFDSHIDTWDPKLLGGGMTEYMRVNHGTFLHIAHEEGLIRNSSIHAGIRAPLMRRKGDLRNDVRCGFEIIQAKGIDQIGVDGIIQNLKDRVGRTNVYVSVDIDVLDPAFAPATGTAEVGGWTTRELLAILDGLEGINIVGADVVEVAPIYDNPGETTVLVAAEIVHSLLRLMVRQAVAGK